MTEGFSSHAEESRYRTLVTARDPEKLLYEWVRTGVVNLSFFRLVLNVWKAQ